MVRQIDRLLSERGHHVETWVRSSQDIEDSLVGKARAFAGMTWSAEAARAMTRRLRDNRPDVVHAHNLYPLFSPSVLAACRKAGVPVVISLHNQGLTCPKADHLREGKICERCFTGSALNCVRHNCRGSMVQSVGYAVRFAANRSRGWIADNATLILGMTDFSRDRLIAAGYPAQKIRVLPNGVEMPESTVNPAGGTYLAFAGRLSEEKGLHSLVEAARMAPEVPLHLAGDGPLADELRAAASPNVTFRGRVPREQMPDFYRRARGLVLPSTCFEMCPLTILEAMSHGLPVIASQTGGLGELVDDGRTGRLFPRGEAEPLAALLQQLWAEPATATAWGAAGRLRAEAEFSEKAFGDRLLELYDEAASLVTETASPRTAAALL